MFNRSPNSIKRCSPPLLFLQEYTIAVVIKNIYIYFFFLMFIFVEVATGSELSVGCKQRCSEASLGEGVPASGVTQRRPTGYPAWLAQLSAEANVEDVF